MLKNTDNSIYLKESLRVGRLCWSFWNRDAGSPSMGSFDRYYWGWKKKDLSDATLQYAVILAVEYTQHRQQTSALPPLLNAYIDFCSLIQHRDGSFDQSYPFERHPSVFYDILPALLHVYQSPYLENHKKYQLEQIMQKGLDFSLKTDETYAAIANHYAQYAYDLYLYNSVFKNDKARRKAELYQQRLLDLFHQDEGWFEEYAGADAGYQTRTLAYLTKCAKLLSSDLLWNVAKSAADFLKEMLTPDGCAHPMLGSRSTALVYPSGFERLARQFPEYSSLAELVRRGWDNDCVPLPSSLDFDNAIRLAEDAHNAHEILSSSKTEKNNGQEHTLEVNMLEKEALFIRKTFPKAGIIIWRNPQVVVYLATRLGGSLVVYQKKGDAWSLIYEDSGYLVTDEKKNIRWLTRMPANSTILEDSDHSIKLKADFLKSLHDELSPLRLILLRILNLTILRWQAVSDLFKKVVVTRLMNNQVKSHLCLERTINLSPHALEIQDNILPAQEFDPERNGLTLYACRRISGTHMASARYFQEEELLDSSLEKIESEERKPISDLKKRIEF